MSNTILVRHGDVLGAPPELTIHYVERLRDELIDALREGGGVTIALDAVGRIDTAALQVLVSARRTAAALGRELVLARPSEAVMGAAMQLGLEQALFGADA